MNFRHPVKWACLGVLTAASLSACVVVPAERPYYARGPVVAVAPPPPQVEYVGPPPVQGYVWIGGFWAWQAGRHVWMRGHWDAPRAGQHWVPHAWVQERGGWRMHEGHWDR